VSNARWHEQSLLQALAGVVQDQKCNLVLARYSQYLCMRIFKNERALSGQRSETALFFEGDVSHAARKYPLILSIEDAEAPRATNLVVKKNLKTAGLSLTSIRQHC
jgi:hypothetical protein